MNRAQQVLSLSQAEEVVFGFVELVGVVLQNTTLQITISLIFPFLNMENTDNELHMQLKSS